MHHGVVMDDMPGKDALTRQLNFSLFRRGKLPGYKSCRKLHGEALKSEFARINAGQRLKSLMARDSRKTTLEDVMPLRPRVALPPADPVRALGESEKGKGPAGGAMRQEPE